MFAAMRAVCTSRRAQSVICAAVRVESGDVACALRSVMRRVLHAVAKRPRTTRKRASIPWRLGRAFGCAKERGVRARIRSVPVPMPACTYWLVSTELLVVQTASRWVASFQTYCMGTHCTIMKTRLMMQNRTWAAMSRESVIRHGRSCLKWRTVNAIPILIRAIVGIQSSSDVKSRW